MIFTSFNASVGNTSIGQRFSNLLTIWLIFEKIQNFDDPLYSWHTEVFGDQPSRLRLIFLNIILVNYHSNHSGKSIIVYTLWYRIMILYTYYTCIILYLY